MSLFAYIFSKCCLFLPSYNPFKLKDLHVLTLTKKIVGGWGTGLFYIKILITSNYFLNSFVFVNQCLGARAKIYKII